MNKQSQWDKAYAKGHNCNFWPNEELVRFLNGYVTKQTSPNTFAPILKPPAKALDFGCGLGRNALLMAEFGLLSYGIDISLEAIKEAKKLSQHLKLHAHFLSYDGKTLPFGDNFFDIVISLGVLECIPKSQLKSLIQEIKRVCNQYFFTLLIGKCPPPPPMS